MKPLLTIERARELLAYDPQTGILTWRIAIGSAVKGAAAGRKNRDGYLQIGLARRTYSVHRLAWFLAYGSWPSALIDHKNGVRSDNRLDNLRLATKSLNGQNKRVAMRHGKSGFLGVTWHKGVSRWQAQIALNGVSHYLGLFDSAEAAHAAYLTKKREMHPGCTI